VVASANFRANSMRKLTLSITKRSDGRVCKRIDGVYVTWPDEATARGELVEMIRRRAEGAEFRGGRTVALDPPLKTIANLYRAAKRSTVKPSTWDDYDEAIKSFLGHVGRFRRVSELRPDDFARVRDAWSRTLGVWRIDNRVQAIRTMLKWAKDVARLISADPWYADRFSKTTAGEKRRSKRERIAARGERVFTADEIKTILANVTGPLRTFVLLGLNCGMYPADIAQIRKTDLKRVDGCWIIDNDREKTGVIRKPVLWPETVKAIEATRDRSESELLFLTVFGKPWVRDDINSITMLFTDLLATLNIKRDGVNFGAFKHTHVSAVGDHHDLNAARLVRGHKFAGIEEHYDFPNLKRLKAVTDLARRRLLSSVPRPPRSRSTSRARGPARPSHSRRVARSS
jgi:integrase